MLNAIDAIGEKGIKKIEVDADRKNEYIRFWIRDVGYLQSL
jgi:hypothetical protein